MRTAAIILLAITVFGPAWSTSDITHHTVRIELPTGRLSDAAYARLQKVRIMCEDAYNPRLAASRFEQGNACAQKAMQRFAGDSTQ